MAAEANGVTVRPGFVIPASELHFSFVRASGPGGQKVNKTATKVRLKWWPKESAALREAMAPREYERILRRVGKELAEDGSLQVVSDRLRTREANREACLRKLAERVRAWSRKRKKRIPTSPTRASRERRLEEKKRRARIKRDRRMEN